MNWSTVRKVVAIMQLIVIISLVMLKTSGHKMEEYAIPVVVIIFSFLLGLILFFEEKSIK